VCLDVLSEGNGQTPFFCQSQIVLFFYCEIYEYFVLRFASSRREPVKVVGIDLHKPQNENFPPYVPHTLPIVCRRFRTANNRRAIAKGDCKVIPERSQSDCNREVPIKFDYRIFFGKRIHETAYAFFLESNCFSKLIA
jgi:hypothetical protein